MKARVTEKKKQTTEEKARTTEEASEREDCREWKEVEDGRSRNKILADEVVASVTNSISHVPFPFDLLFIICGAGLKNLRSLEQRCGGIKVTLQWGPYLCLEGPSTDVEKAVALVEGKVQRELTKRNPYSRRY